MRELDDAALELRLRGALTEHLDALRLDLTVEELDRRREARDAGRRRRRGLIALGLAAAVLIPIGVLVGAGRPLLEAFDGPLPSPDSTASPTTSASEPALPTPSIPAPSPTVFIADGPRVYADEFAGGTPLAVPMRRPLLVPLLDDRVLILGNEIAEIYDPNDGSQEQVTSLLESGVMSATRAADGTVLVIGLRPGVGNANEGLVTQVFDPRTAFFSAGGPMLTPRQDSLLVALADGRILIDGGRTSVDGPDIPVKTLEIFDPATKTFADAGFTTGTLGVDQMTLLADGRVLMTGARNQRTPNHTTQATGTPAAVLYDPSTGSITSTGRPLHRYSFVRSGPRGGVLAIWADESGNESGLDAWDPSSGTFRQVVKTPMLAGLDSSAVEIENLQDGRLIATLNYDTLLIDPSGNVTSLPGRRAWDPSAAVLADGRVMIAGGTVDGVYHPNALGNGGAPAELDTVLLFH